MVEFCKSLLPEALLGALTRSAARSECDGATFYSSAAANDARASLSSSGHAMVSHLR